MLRRRDALVAAMGAATSQDIHPVVAAATPAVLATLDGPTLSGDAAALAAALARLPPYAEVRVQGALVITQPLVINHPINLVCPTRADFIRPDLGPDRDAVHVVGSLQGFKGLRLQLNVFGQAACCRRAVVVERVDASFITVEVHCGATDVAVQLDGCLSNDVRITSSNNDPSPYAEARFQRHHLRLGKTRRHNPETGKDDLFVTNANRIRVVIEGHDPAVTGATGIATLDMEGQGNNVVTGTIEGLGDGRPLDWVGCADAELRDLHLEANRAAATFTGCQNLRLASVRDPAGRMTFLGCRGVSVDAYHGALLDFDAACSGITLGRLTLDDDFDGRVTDASGSAEAVGGSASLVTRGDVLDGLTGRASLENLFHNPYLDLWSAGPDALPDGVQLDRVCGSAGAGARCIQVRRETAQVWPGNPVGVAARFTVPSGLLAQDGPSFVLAAPFGASTVERWISFLLPVLIESGPQLDVFVQSGNAPPVRVAQVTTAGSWVPVRATVRVPAGQSLAVLLRAANLDPEPHEPEPMPTRYLVGGCAIVAGTSAPKDLCDHGRRAAHVVGRVDHPPAFVGQRALGARRRRHPDQPRWYMAAGTQAASDWVAL